MFKYIDDKYRRIGLYGSWYQLDMPLDYICNGDRVFKLDFVRENLYRAKEIAYVWGCENCPYRVKCSGKEVGENV